MTVAEQLPRAETLFIKSFIDKFPPEEILFILVIYIVHNFVLRNTEAPERDLLWAIVLQKLEAPQKLQIRLVYKKEI